PRSAARRRGSAALPQRADRRAPARAARGRARARVRRQAARRRPRARQRPRRAVTHADQAGDRRAAAAARVRDVRAARPRRLRRDAGPPADPRRRRRRRLRRVRLLRARLHDRAGRGAHRRRRRPRRARPGARRARAGPFRRRPARAGAAARLRSSSRDRDAPVRPARHRRAHRGPQRLRARGRRLLRADRVEPRAHPRRQAFLPLRPPVGAAAPAREAAPPRRRGLARARQPRLLPGPGRARDHAHRADRRALARHRGAHLSAFELGLGLQSDKTVEHYEQIARRSEAAGFDVLSVFQDLFFPPAIVPLVAMARVTERVRLGPAALNAQTLHPVEIAGQIAALDRASNGRAYLGLVTGAWLDRLGLDEERPLTRLREAVEVVRRLLARDAGGFAGERFTLAPGAALTYEPLRASVPLLIGAWKPRTA